MSTPSVSPTASLPEEGFWRKVTLCALGSLMIASLWWVWQGELNADEGFYLLSSVRVLEGLHPWRDFGFTQMPFLAYANVPWLQLWGFDLVGIRLTGLSWLWCAVALGVVVLRRRHGWSAAAVFVILMVSAPAGLDLMVKGKTYALAGLALLGAQLVLMGASRGRGAWICFLVCAAAGVATRLPTLAYFLPAWIGMVVGTTGLRARLSATGVTVFTAIGVLMMVVGGDWEAFRYWVIEIHQGLVGHSHVGRSWARLWWFAPGIWAAALFAMVATGKSARRPEYIWCWAPLLLVVLANVGPTSGYVEYLTMVMPALAVASVPAIVRWGSDWSKGALVVIGLGFVGLGWWRLPPTHPILLEEAGMAAAFLAEHTSEDAQVVASMPIIAVAAQRQVPVDLSMGKFGLTEEMDDLAASRLHMVTPGQLAELMERTTTEALVFSTGFVWNFSWTFPSMRQLSPEGVTTIRSVIDRDYSLAFAGEHFVIFLRNGDTEQ